MPNEFSIYAFQKLLEKLGMKKDDYIRAIEEYKSMPVDDVEFFYNRKTGKPYGSIAPDEYEFFYNKDTGKSYGTSPPDEYEFSYDRGVDITPTKTALIEYAKRKLSETYPSHGYDSVLDKLARDAFPTIKSRGTSDQEISEAEMSGEVAQRRGGSSYKAAEYVPESIARPSFDQIPVGGRKPLEVKPTFNYDQFKSSLDSYVSDSLQSEAEDEAERRANSVNIDIPGGYESLQRIAREAIAKGRGGGELVFGDPDAEQHYLMGGRGAEWPFEVSRQYPDTKGVSVPGGTFSQMGRTLTGGDSPEDLRRYADEVRRNQTAIKIATIEASAPAKYRSPATNEYLKMLYEQKAAEEASSVAAMNAAANMRQAQTEAEITGPAQAKYYNEYGPSQIRVAELGVEEALIRGEQANQANQRFYWDDVLASLRKSVETDPKLRPILSQVTAIVYDPNLSWDQKKSKVNEILGASGDPAEALAEVDKKLWYTPGG